MRVNSVWLLCLLIVALSTDAFYVPAPPKTRWSRATPLRMSADDETAPNRNVPPESDRNAKVDLTWASPSAMDLDLEDVREVRQQIANVHAQLRAANGKAEFGKAAELQRQLDILHEKEPLAVLDREIAAATFKQKFDEVRQLKEKKNLLNRLCPIPVVRKNRLIMLSENGMFLTTVEPNGKKIRRFNKRLDSFAPTSLPPQGKVRQIQQPTWSRKGDRIAFVNIIVGAAGVEKSQLVVMEEETLKLVQAVPVDSLPIYMQWAPDDSYITYLSNGKDGRVSLYYVEVRTDTVKKVRSKVLDSGTPLFYSFTGPDPTNADLVVHNAERKTIYKYDGHLGPGPIETRPEELPSDRAEALPISMGPGNFMAPRGWSASPGSFAETRWGSIVVENGFLVTVDVSGRFRRRLVPVRGVSSFVLSPDQSHIALIQSDVKTGHYSLSLIDVGEFGLGLDPRASPLPKIKQKELEVDTICKAVFFSPDSSKLLLFSLPYQRSDVSIAANAFKSNFAVNCRCLVYDMYPKNPEAENPVKFLKFTPRQSFTRLYMPFFDQYAQSYTPWSPDSKSFVFVAEEGVFVQPLPDPMPTSVASMPSMSQSVPSSVAEEQSVEDIVVDEHDEDSTDSADPADPADPAGSESAPPDYLMVPSMEALQEALDAARKREESGAPESVLFSGIPKPIRLGKGVELAVWSWN